MLRDLQMDARKAKRDKVNDRLQAKLRDPVAIARRVKTNLAKQQAQVR